MIYNQHLLGLSFANASALFLSMFIIENEYIFVFGFIPTLYIIACATEYLQWNPNKKLITKPCKKCGNETLLLGDFHKPECLDCYKLKTNEETK